MTKVKATVRAAGAFAVMMLADAAVTRAQVPIIPPGTRVRLDAPRPNAGLVGTVRSQSAVFLVAGYVASPNHNCGGADECLDPIAALLYLVPASALIGGLAGAFIGAIAGVERWDRLYPAPVRVSILPAPNGVTRVGLSLGF
jgi:hypothetical protein